MKAAAITPLVVEDPAALAESAARWTGERVQRAVAERGACYLALAGGETPRGCYQRLAQPPYREALPWARVFVYWSDERQVPLDDPASNFAMAKAALLDHVPIPAEQVSPSGVAARWQHAFVAHSSVSVRFWLLP